jgi:N-acetyl-alpha-D-muramate 1-phosphate uridylyltransferase
MRAMILAAGRGERMRPLTDHTPKPLLMAGGKPLIVWHIERLVAAGICNLVINHAHLGAQIEAALGDGSRWAARIRYSPENPVLETAGGIANALPLLCPPDDDPNPFAVINGDIYCDYDFAQLPARAAALSASGDMAHLVLVMNPAHHAGGDFCLQGNRIAPKTPIDATGSGTAHTFSGIGIYQPVMFAALPRGTVAPLAPMLHEQIAQRRISGELYTGQWMDVGTPERLKELDKQLRASQNATHA